MLQLLYFLEQIGIGLPRSEMFALMLSIRNFVKIEPVESVRFWGCIRGLYKNYYILETELREEEYVKRNEVTQIFFWFFWCFCLYGVVG